MSRYGFLYRCEHTIALTTTELQKNCPKTRWLKMELYVVRESNKIIALFTSEQRARFYCRENLANLHYQKEEWIRKGVVYDE